MEPIESGSSQFASWIDGMEYIESGSSDQFVSWIDGKGPFVPLPLPADAVPQVVVTSVGLRLDMGSHLYTSNDEYLDGFGPHPAPRIAPVNYRAVPYNTFPTQFHETRVVPIVKQVAVFDFQRFFIDRSRTNGPNSCMENGICIWSDGTLPWSDLADRMFGKSLKKPFGVVSVIQDTHDNASGHEASSGEYDEEKAIKFLEDEMKSNTAFTVNKTVQTAISAFQHLFGQKFKANEIRVILWKEDGDIVKDLPRRDDPSIEEVVAVIRGR